MPIFYYALERNYNIYYYFQNISARQRLKKVFIPLLLVLKLFKLKLLLMLPLILGIAGIKKIILLSLIIIPALFLYLKLSNMHAGAGGSILSNLFANTNSFPQYSPQGVGSATFHHYHATSPQQHEGNPYARRDPVFARPLTNENYHSSKSNMKHINDVVYKKSLQ